MSDLQDIIGVQVQWPTTPKSVSPNSQVFAGLPVGSAAAVVEQQLLLLSQGKTTLGSMSDDDIGSPFQEIIVDFHPDGVASVSPDHQLVLLVNPDCTFFLHSARNLADGKNQPIQVGLSPGLFDFSSFGKAKVVWSGQAALAWCGPNAILITTAECCVVRLHLNACDVALCAPVAGASPDTVVCVEAETGTVYTVGIADSTTPYRLVGAEGIIGVIARGPLVCLRTFSHSVLIVANIYVHLHTSNHQLSTIQSSERGHCHFFTFGVSRAARVFNSTGNPSIHPSGNIICVPQVRHLLFVRLDDNNEPKPIANMPVLSTGGPCALQWSPDGRYLAYLNTVNLRSDRNIAYPPGKTVVTVEVEQGVYGLTFHNVCYNVDAVETEAQTGSHILWAPSTLILVTPTAIRTWPF